MKRNSKIATALLGGTLALSAMGMGFASWKQKTTVTSTVTANGAINVVGTATLVETSKSAGLTSGTYRPGDQSGKNQNTQNPDKNQTNYKEAKESTVEAPDVTLAAPGAWAVYEVEFSNQGSVDVDLKSIDTNVTASNGVLITTGNANNIFEVKTYYDEEDTVLEVDETQTVTYVVTLTNDETKLKNNIRDYSGYSFDNLNFTLTVTVNHNQVEIDAYSPAADDTE